MLELKYVTVAIVCACFRILLQLVTGVQWFDLLYSRQTGFGTVLFYVICLFILLHLISRHAFLCHSSLINNSSSHNVKTIKYV